MPLEAFYSDQFWEVFKLEWGGAERSGYLVYMDRPEETARVMMDFLKGPEL